MAYLGNVYGYDYEDETIIYLKQREGQRYRLHHSSPQLKYRRNLVTKIISIANSLKLSESTIHLAVYVLDIYMDCHNITLQRLELVCFACISVAAKYEERDESPKILELLSFVSEQPGRGHLLQMEYIILKFLNWNFFPTAAHFADTYIQYSVCQEDVENFGISREEIIRILKRQTKIYLRLSLLDESLFGKRPSLVGVACIAAARERLNLVPLQWKNFTGYRTHEIGLISQMLITFEESRWLNSENKSVCQQCCHSCCCCCCCCSTSAVSCAYHMEAVGSSSVVQPNLPLLSVTCNVQGKKLNIEINYR